MISRIAGISAGIAGVSAATGTLLAARREDGPGMLVGAGLAGAGALALGGGLGAARWGEQALRPGITRAARSSAAIGAAVLTGAIAGGIASFVAGRFAAHRDTDDARGELDAANAHAAKSAEEAKVPGALEAQAGRAGELAKEAAQADVELQIDDGRVDLVGAPVSAAASTLFSHYDTDGNGLRVAEQQRTVGDRTYSIGATMASFLDGRAKDQAGVPPIASAAGLEQFLSDKVDTGGRSGTIDVDEARRWYADAGPGERNVTWGWKSHLESIASIPQGDYQASLDEDRRTTYSLGAFSEKTPMLALPGVDDLTTAQRIAGEAADEQNMAMAVVELPEAAPTKYALATLQVNGEPTDGYFDEAAPIHGRLHESVKLVTNGEATVRLDQPRSERSDARQPAGTIPASGRTIEALATDIAERYDARQDGLWIGDTQRTDDTGRTFTVAPLFIQANRERVEAKPGEFLKFDTTAKLADAIRATAADDGDPKVLDGMELSSWNSEYGSGERDITWGWEDYFKQVADGTKKADGDVRLAPFGDDGPLLALPTVYTLDTALRWAQQVATADGSTIAVVDLPDDAPVRYALARLKDRDGYGIELTDDLKQGKGLDSRVTGVADAKTRATISR